MAAAVWVYSLVAALWLLIHARHPETSWWLSNWAGIPGQGIALVLVVLLLRDVNVRGTRRTAWWLVLCYIVLSVIASIVWNESWADPRDPGITIADTLYYCDFLLLVAACALFYRAAGGSLRRPQFWRDVATIAVAMLAALWAFLFAPFLLSGATHALNVATTLVYAIVLTVMMAMGALLAIQTLGLRGQLVPVSLVGALLAEVGSEIAWLAGQLTGRSYVGLFYNYGDVLCFALIATAAAAERRVSPVRDAERSLESSAYGFLPALSVLVAIALIAGSSITAEGWDAWIRVVLVLLGALLLVTRQLGVRKEVARLHHALSVRESDARVTELVRRSDSLIVVANDKLELTFVSPAADPMLGVPPPALKSTSATLLLGPDNEMSLSLFLSALQTRVTMTAEVEATYATPAGAQRLLHVSGANQLDNPLIAGISLTITDVTTQRTLEREIVDIASRERLRLCSDIHEGLGQELSGIALLLRTAATHPQPDPNAQREALEAIVAHVNRTIAISRDLAAELSPIHVARDSLVGALGRLAENHDTDISIRGLFDPGLDHAPIDVAMADHLYRIAKEGVSNAIRHSGGSMIEIALALRGRELTLTVTDDGRGVDPRRKAAAGLGVRMMRYRARTIGGALRIDPATGGGTRLSVVVPLPIDVAPRDQMTASR